MKKQWTAALLALVLTIALLPGTAYAAGAAGGAGSRLSGPARTLYDTLRAETAKIAAGTRTTTQIRIPDIPSLYWSLEELDHRNPSEALNDKLMEALEIERVFCCLTADCPYDLYWQGTEIPWTFSTPQRDGMVGVSNLTISLRVSRDYQEGSDVSVSAAKVSAAQKAAQNAKAIVERHKDKSDYEKLCAYRDEICALTSYNMDAFRDLVPYGDPWQAVYVFDGNPATNVVCEGYSKAFKYLCDLSEFQGDVTCYLASGMMDGGNHMWNVVRMGDGACYLADVTNSDAGMVGSGGGLFLAGGTSSADSRTVVVSKDQWTAVYTYREGEKDLFTDGYLPVSGEDYVDRPVQAQPSGTVLFADVEPGSYYEDAVAWAVEQGVTNGTSATTFSPGRNCTHGQILTFLWRAAGEPETSGPAPDGVREEDYFYDAVRWATGKDMLEDGFDPGADCTRADAVRYIWSAFDRPSAPAASFTDVPAGMSFTGAVDWAVERGVTTGTSDTTFSPDSVCTRGQIATFLHRAYRQGASE